MSLDPEVWPFDAAHLEAAANEHAVDRERLESLVADHQTLMADSPGVENLLYEWRKQFDATLLGRSADAYFVAAPPWIWEEFSDHLEASASEVRALAAVHERTVRANADANEARAGESVGCILVRSN